MDRERERKGERRKMKFSPSFREKQSLKHFWKPGSGLKHFDSNNLWLLISKFFLQEQRDLFLKMTQRMLQNTQIRNHVIFSYFLPFLL